MSSADEGAAPTHKKRKVQRACDNCRNKKIKCDGICMPNSCCSNCATRRIECTYFQGIDSYSRHYVESLEGRLERMEKLVSKLSGGLDIDITQGSDNDVIQTPSPALEVEQPRASGSRAKARATRIPITPPATVGLATPRTVDSGPHSDSEEDSEDNDEFSKELTEGLQQLSIGSQPSRYHGKSSGFVFMKSAMALKDELEPADAHPPTKEDEQHPWLDAFVEDDFPLLDERSFPPQDLLDALVDLYFRHINSHIPLLHEPTFKRAIEAGQHLRDGGFGATVLLVCANGARFARADPRVLLEGPGSKNPHSAGWRWFSLVEKARRLSFAPAKLHDLQIYVLIALFLQGTAAPHTTWAVIGAGIRAAVDVGAHRKKMYTSSPTPTVEEELWRRAFWILVGMEWVLGYGLGRPCSLHPEDIDLALPTECDDEHWLGLEGESAFKQPLGKPCKVSGFIYSLRLARLLAVAARTIYLRNKSRTQLPQGSDDQWEQRTVVELDSALNKWAENLPSHLRWDPKMEDELFLAQAASLKASYYNYQIAIHRSFASSSSRSHSPLSSIVCTNAARSSIQVLDVLYKRTGSPWYGNMGILITSGTILMVNILGLKRTGRATNVNRDLDLVRKVIEMLRSLRYEMQVAEPLAKMFIEMMSAVTEAGHTSESSAQGLGAPEGTSPEHTQFPHTSQRPPPGEDATNVGSAAGSSSASLASAPPLDAPFRIPPEFEFLLSNPSPFALPPDEGVGPAVLGFTMPIDGSDTSSMQQVLLPLQSQHASGALAGATPGAPDDNQFYIVGQQAFGLEPLGYDVNESMALLSSFSQVGTHASNTHTQAHHYFGMGADTATPSGSGFALDGGGPDFASMDDEQISTFLSNFPPVVGSGSEDWGEFFANANNLNTGP